MQVLPTECQNFFDDLNDDWETNAEVWREITEEDWSYALQVLPPRLFNRNHETDEMSFLIGEPYSITRDGTWHDGFAAIGGKFYARRVLDNQFKKRLEELREACYLLNQREVGQQT